MPDGILAIDRLSMCHSLEVRVPTLIRSLVVFQTRFDLYVDGIPRATQRAVPAA